jgi:putative hydrolase of the HAD superfamily
MATAERCIVTGSGSAASRFDAVIFDLFGTLVPEFPKTEFYASVRAIGLALGLDEEGFRREWERTMIPRQTGIFPTMADNILAICASMGAPSPSPDDLDAALHARMTLYHDRFVPRDGAMATLRGVRERGLPIALVSMCAPDVPEMWHATELAPLVDATVFSCVAGLRKPDPPIYLAATEALGVDPRACLYCGDGAYGELTGAAAVGMTPYLIDDPAVDQAEMLTPERDDWSGASISHLAEILTHLDASR